MKNFDNLHYKRHKTSQHEYQSAVHMLKIAMNNGQNLYNVTEI